MVRSASVLLRGRPEDGSPSPLSPDAGWGNHGNIDYRHRRSVARDGSCMLTNKIHTAQRENAMNRSIALGLAMLAGAVIGAIAVNGLHAQNKAPGAYAALDLRAINSPDVFKTLPSKTGDFDGHTA
jgi:hypothetical protein